MTEIRVINFWQFIYTASEGYHPYKFHDGFSRYYYNVMMHIGIMLISSPKGKYLQRLRGFSVKENIKIVIQEYTISKLEGVQYCGGYNSVLSGNLSTWGGGVPSVL